MDIIQKIKFPQNSNVATLYIKSSNKATPQKSNYISLHKNEKISLNTYFNSFYQSFYTKYTTLNNFYYLINLEGDFKITSYKTIQNGKNEHLNESKKTNCKKGFHTRINLLIKNSTKNKIRLYLELTCLSEKGYFYGGYLATDNSRRKNISLGIVICTFKRESRLKQIVEAILENHALQHKDFTIFIVDNGKTLKKADFMHAKLRLIPNRNLGGSGGFARGLIEALREGKYTHFLLMDDDIEVDSESILRLFSLYEYSREDFAVAGSMLDSEEKNVLIEAGALCYKGFNPFLPFCRKNKLPLEKPENLNQLLKEETIDYGGFWFFAFSKDTLLKTGLPFPMFIRRDDMEFCKRIKKLAHRKIIPFPSIAVWHKVEFSPKDPYYIARNALILLSIHYNLGYLQTIIAMTSRIINTHLLRFNYNGAETFIKGFQDYLKGPDFLKNLDPEANHLVIERCTKKHRDRRDIQKNIYETYGAKAPIHIKLKKLFLMFTLENAISIKILLKWLKIAVKSKEKWHHARDEWRKSSLDFTTEDFWNKYLGIAKEKSVCKKDSYSVQV